MKNWNKSELIGLDKDLSCVALQIIEEYDKIHFRVRILCTTTEGSYTLSEAYHVGNSRHEETYMSMDSAKRFSYEFAIINMHRFKLETISPTNHVVYVEEHKDRAMEYFTSHPCSIPPAPSPVPGSEKSIVWHRPL
jgi:hypothetical protein